MTRTRRWAAALVAAFALLGAGCATPPRPAEASASTWAGRLALQVQDSPGESFSAGFELKGSAQLGELTLFSPLGGSLAVLSWLPGQATLRTGGQVRQFESADALIAQVTGSPIPVAALFDWLRGTDTRVAGWQADLSQVGQGRVLAKRFDPPPEADLRVILER